MQTKRYIRNLALAILGFSAVNAQSNTGNSSDSSTYSVDTAAYYGVNFDELQGYVT